MASPTTSYDVQIVNATGYDVLEGLGMDRDQAAEQHANLIYASTSCHPPIDETDALTLRVTSNSIASARILIDLYYALGSVS